MKLDLFTLGLMGLLIALVEAISFTLLGLVLRGLPALRIWAAAFWIAMLGVVIHDAIGMLPPALVLAVGNALISLANALMLIGLAVHLRRRLDLRVPLAIVSAYVVWQIYLSVTGAGNLPRVITFGLHSLLWDAWMIWLLLARAPRDLRKSSLFTAAVVMIDAGFHVWKLGVVTLSASPGHDAVHGPVAMAAYLLSALDTLLLSTAFVMLLAERLTHDLERRARTDGLTGLLDHSAVLEDGARVLQRCRRRHGPCSVLMLDLDHFKSVNDTWGHVAGDAVLGHVVKLLRDRVLPADALFARYGGEEFVIVLPELPIEAACAVAERVRCRIIEHPLPHEPQPIAVTTSIGVAADDGRGDFGTLVSRADAALYQAKRHGRNRFARAGDEMRSPDDAMVRAAP